MLLAHAAVRRVALTARCVHGAQVLRRAAAAAAEAEAAATAAAQVARAAEDKAVAEAAAAQKLIDDKAALKAELEFLTAEVARFTAEEDERLRVEAEEVGAACRVRTAVFRRRPPLTGARAAAGGESGDCGGEGGQEEGGGGGQEEVSSSTVGPVCRKCCIAPSTVRIGNHRTNCPTACGRTNCPQPAESYSP